MLGQVSWGFYGSVLLCVGWPSVRPAQLRNAGEPGVLRVGRTGSWVWSACVSSGYLIVCMVSS